MKSRGREPPADLNYRRAPFREFLPLPSGISTFAVFELLTLVGRSDAAIIVRHGSEPITVFTSQWSLTMFWTAPVVVEVCLGMEVTTYASAKS